LKAAKGEVRNIALQEAAELLLSKYRKLYGEVIPVNVSRLAETLDARIMKTRGLHEKKEACILPCKSGFDILVNPFLVESRFRSVVAHELGHILFFVEHKGSIVRLANLHPELQEKEEHFCFDLARYLLAPSWILDRIGIRTIEDVKEVFMHLWKTLQLSKNVASQVLFQDQMLFVGRADVWKWNGSEWRQARGLSYPHPSLRSKRKLNEKVKDAARAWLKGEYDSEFQVFGFWLPPDKTGFRSAFVVVAVSSYEGCSKSHPAVDNWGSCDDIANNYSEDDSLFMQVDPLLSRNDKQGELDDV